jgi:hypothetical protein
VRGRVLTETVQRHTRRLILMAVVTLVDSTLARAGEEPIADVELPSPMNTPATLSFGEIRQGILDSIGRIKALDAELTQLCRFNDLDETATTVVPYTFQRNAFKGERRYVFSRRLEHPDRGTLENDIAAPPGLGEAIRVYDGEVQRCYMPYGASAAAVYGRKDGSADAQVYAHALSLPIADDVRSLKREIRAWAGWPPDVYDLPVLRWVVEPMCQSVDGHVCHVIAEPTLGWRQWIDPEAGYAMRFHEVKQRKDQRRPAGADIEIRRWHSAFKEVAKGIWLPYRLVSVTYAVRDTASVARGAIVGRDDVVAVRLAVNDEVPDSLFELRFKPGTIVTDEVRGVHYMVGNNGEELSPQSDEARRLFNGITDTSSIVDRRASIWFWINAAVVTALGGFLLMRILRKRRWAAEFR